MFTMSMSYIHYLRTLIILKYMHLTKTISFIASMSFLLLACIKEEVDGDAIINHININDHVPAFVVHDTTGNDFNSKEFTGKQSLLVFFGSYCNDCKRILPVIEEVWKEMKNDPGFLLTPISRREAAEDVINYWKANGFTMPFYLDQKGEAFSLFANSTIPRIYIINSNNVVVWMSVESLDLTASELIEKIKGLKE